MNITQQEHLDAEMLNALTRIWEGAVRATHHFLTEQDIVELRPLVRQALQTIESLYVCCDNSGEPLAFLGLADGHVEMLFVDPDARGGGIGRRMINHAKALGAHSVSVNEQNPQAVGFYEHMGFVTVARQELDDQGRPFPLLHMKLKDAT